VKFGVVLHENLDDQRPANSGTHPCGGTDHSLTPEAWSEERSGGGISWPCGSDVLTPCESSSALFMRILGLRDREQLGTGRGRTSASYKFSARLGLPLRLRPNEIPSLGTWSTFLVEPRWKHATVSCQQHFLRQWEPYTKQGTSTRERSLA
jgi:hypothetical protein